MYQHAANMAKYLLVNGLKRHVTKLTNDAPPPTKMTKNNTFHIIIIVNALKAMLTIEWISII